jgi:hypothetical protein
MAATRRRWTWKSCALVPCGSRVEKPWSPAAREIPAWVLDYQRRAEQARLQHIHMKVIEYPEETQDSQGELEMPDANSNLVQKQLSELMQQVVYIVQACNEEKELLEAEFESVWANIEILDGRIQTDKRQVDVEVAGVGTQLQSQEAVL